MLVFSLVLRPHTQSVPSPTLIYLHMQNHAVTNLVCCILMHNHAVTNLAPMLHPYAQSCSHQLSSHVAFTCTKAPIAQPDSPQPPELLLHNQTVPSLPSSLHNQTVPSLPCSHCTTRQSPASQAPLHNQTVPSLPSSHCTTRQSPASQATIAQPDSPQSPKLPLHNQTVPSLRMHSSQSPNPQPGSSQPPTLCLTSACTIRKL